MCILVGLCKTNWLCNIKTDICNNITEDVETRFDTSNYELDRSLPKVKKTIVIGLIKDELGGKIMTKFVGLKEKTCNYLIDDDSEDKKAKGTKKSAIKKLKSGNWKKTVEKQLNLRIKSII